MLEQMQHRLRASKTFEAAINTVLDDVMALHGAEYGDFQLCCGGDVIIVAQRKLPRAFVTQFGHIKAGDTSASGRALKTRRSVVIPDVDREPSYKPWLVAARLAGYRSIQSTPLITSAGRMLGVVSTLFANPHQPTNIEMDTLNQYSSLASDYLARLLGDEDMETKAAQMYAKLKECFD
jgi:GAF domain-containing protein